MDKTPWDEEELLDTDSDDSDFSANSNEEDSDTESSSDPGSSAESPCSSSDSEKLSSSNRDKKEEEEEDDDDDDDDDEDDSDYVAEDDGSDRPRSSSGSGSEGSSSGDDDADSEGGDIGQAPFTGYIFPAIHKLVAGNQLEAMTAYLAEMFDPEQTGPQVWEVSDSLGRNAVHLAILHGNLMAISILMDYDKKLIETKFANEETDMKWKLSAFRRKFDDMSVLHLAMSNGPWNDDLAIQIFELLRTHPGYSQFPTTDYWKRTPLHIAVMTGKLTLVEYLARQNPEWLFVVDSLNMLPLHYAIDNKNSQLVDYLLSAYTSQPDQAELFQTSISTLLPEDRHPITHAISKCSWECLVIVCRYMGEHFPPRAIEIAHRIGIEISGLNDVCQNLEAAQKFVHDRSRDTALVFDLDCLGHVRLPEESEDGHGRLKRIKFVVENPNRLEVLVGAHGSLKTSEFQNLRIMSSAPPCPIGDVVRVHEWAYIRKIMSIVDSISSSSAMARLDKGDTNITAESWQAALKASGCVIQAMDLVCAESCKNAFVAVRPPGHHVSSRGAVDPNLEDDDTGSNGFCLLNNVAIGAAYALSVHRHVIQKVAIVDIDIHHGNGTEAIVRGLAEPKVISIPLHFTGLSGNLEMHSYHPWLDPSTDKDNVFFASVHRFDGRFYPQSGRTGIDGNIVNAGLESFSTSADFRRAFNHLVLPQLAAFRPDLIMISAGFDGHVRDRLASGEWDITEDDYYWITEQLIAIANMYSKGRIVSVLEGGYNTKGGWLSPLAQSVASHVRALSSSWACKWEEPPMPEDSESEEEEDATMGDERSHDSMSPQSKRQKTLDDNIATEQFDKPNEFNELFGGDE